MSEAGPAAVRLQSISKRFGAVTALDSVSLEFQAGRVHALLGENGAGKSTLLSILYGLQQPDAGLIELSGKKASRLTPSESRTNGVAFVQQHFSLIPAFTVSDNLMLGNEPGLWRLSRQRFREKIDSILQRFGFDLPWDKRVSQLSVGEQQRVEIAKALSQNARVFLFDEPTASLAPDEIEDCLETVRSLRGQGVSVVFVTHHLDEALRVADEITVLRNGRTVLHQSSPEFDKARIASAIVGDELPNEAYELPAAKNPILRIENAETLTIPHPLSLELRQGEILGIAGVSGNGQQEWMDLILGKEPLRGGAVWLNENNLTCASIFERRMAGMAYIPQDLHRDGLFDSRPLWENLLLNPAVNQEQSWLLPVNQMRAEALSRISKFSVRAESELVAPTTLSGGHQQRFVLARELAARPKVVLAHDPARGLDIRAARFVHEALVGACRQGAGVLLFSSGLSELFLLCARIGVISQGRLVAIKDAADWDTAALGRAMAGGGQ